MVRNQVETAAVRQITAHLLRPLEAHAKRVVLASDDADGAAAATATAAAAAAAGGGAHHLFAGVPLARAGAAQPSTLLIELRRRSVDRSS